MAIPSLFGATFVGTALVSNGAMEAGALVAATQSISMILLSIMLMAGVASAPLPRQAYGWLKCKAWTEHGAGDAAIVPFMI